MTSLASSKHIEHALELIVCSELEDTSAAQQTRAKLAQWRLAKPEHELAYHEALRQWQLLGNIAPELKEQFPQPAANHAEKTNRHHLLSITGVIMGIGIIAKAGIWYWHQPVFEQTMHTDIAQVQHTVLPDGTQLDINARSDLQVTLYRHKREVILNSGEVRFAVSHDAHAPFNVHTREGDVQVVGTIFTVADRGRSVNITVEQGHVRFHGRTPIEATSTGTTSNAIGANSPIADLVDLYADEYLLIRDGQHGAKTRIDTAYADAWRDGWLVFNNVPLEDAIPQINAFRHSPIVLGSYKASQLRLTGRFRANNSQQLDNALPKILPVQVKYTQGGNTLVTTR